LYLSTAHIFLLLFPPPFSSEKISKPILPEEKKKLFLNLEKKKTEHGGRLAIFPCGLA